MDWNCSGLVRILDLIGDFFLEEVGHKEVREGGGMSVGVWVNQTENNRHLRDQCYDGKTRVLEKGL